MYIYNQIVPLRLESSRNRDGQSCRTGSASSMVCHCGILLSRAVPLCRLSIGRGAPFAAASQLEGRGRLPAAPHCPSLGPTLTTPAVCRAGPPWTPDHPLSPNLPLSIRRVGAQRRRRRPRADGHVGPVASWPGTRKRIGRWHGAKMPDKAGGPRPSPAEARTAARYARMPVSARVEALFLRRRISSSKSFGPVSGLEDVMVTCTRPSRR
jgi:hypothetical protein